MNTLEQVKIFENNYLDVKRTLNNHIMDPSISNLDTSKDFLNPSVDLLLFISNYINESYMKSGDSLNYTANSSSLAAANILLKLIEAFYWIHHKKDSKSLLEENDYYFRQPISQIMKNARCTKQMVVSGLDYLKELELISTRTGSKNTNLIQLNFLKLASMFKEIEITIFPKEIESWRTLNEDIRKNKDKWERINNALNKGDMKEASKDLAELDLTEEQIIQLIAITKGLLTYRKTVFKWSKVSFNTIFGKNSKYKIPFKDMNNDFLRLMAACDPKYKRKLKRPLKYLLPEVITIYKRLDNKSNFDEVLKELDVNEVTDEYIKENNLKIEG